MLKGLINAKGVEVDWADVAKDYDPEDWVIPEDITCGPKVSWPLGVLIGMRRDEAHRDLTTLHISSLVQAPRRELLKERNDYYIAPHSLIYIIDGRAHHLWLETAHPEGAEQKVVIELEGATIEGTADKLLERKLTDYKRMKSYGLQKCVENGIETEKPDYCWQLRFYAELFTLAGREVEPPYTVWVSASDWQREWRRGRQSSPRYGEFQVAPVPTQEHSLRQSIKYRLDIQAMDPADMPPCGDREAFGVLKTGCPRRCAEYCEANQFCDWFQKKGWK
jgi:hypothetical protein